MIGAIFGWTLVWYGGFWLWASGEPAFGYALPIFIMLAATFGADCLRRLFKRKYSLSNGLALLCVYAPAAAWVLPSIIVMIRHHDRKYAGFMEGLAYGYEQQYTPAAAAALVGGALLWFGVWALASKKKGG